MLRKFVQEYLTFSRKERIAILCITTAMVGIFFLPRFFARAPTPIVVLNGVGTEPADPVLTSNQTPEGTEQHYTELMKPRKYEAFTDGALFNFDPNTLDAQGWLKLGLNEKTTRTILNYRNKGGKFYKAEDLLRVWGMPEGFYERVKRYIVITSVKQPSYENHPERPAYTRPERKPLVVNINEADTASFIELPGIGSKLAGRIVSFREKLGGFHSVEQVAETFGLPDSTFQKIKPKLTVNGAVKKLNINTATKDELKLHPYIRWNLANAIVEYRNQHGAYTNLTDLKRIALVDETTFLRIAPYLEL